MGRIRLLILVLVILLLGVVAVIFLVPMLTGGEGLIPGLSSNSVESTPKPEETAVPTATTIPAIQIVVAVQEIPRGFRIPAENAVQLRAWPREAAPFNALQDPEEAVGKIARIDIPSEAPVLSNHLVDDMQFLVDVGSDAAAIMPEGLVAISVPMDRLTGIAYAIRPGDYVDVIFSMLYVDVDEDFQSALPNSITLISVDEDGNLQPQDGIEGRLDVGIGGAPVIVGPAEDQRPRLVTQRTVQSAWVIGVGNFPFVGSYIGSTPTPIPSPTPETEDGGDTAARPAAAPQLVQAPDIITLAVTPQDAVVLVWAIESKIPITLALRSATDYSQVPTQPVSMEYIMTNFNISAPDRLPYALEPAIRSIRQLIAFEEIKLRDEVPPPQTVTE